MIWKGKQYMKQIHSVIDIGTSKIVCAIVEVSDKTSYNILGLASASYAGIRKGQFVNPAKLVDSILDAVEKAEQQAGKKVKSVFVGIPGCFIKVACNDATINIDGGEVTPDNIEFLAEQAQKFFVPEKMEVLHKSPIGFRVDDGKKTMAPVGTKTKELTGVFSFATVEKDMTRFLLDVFDQLKMDVDEFVAAPLTQGLLFTPDSDRMALSIIVDVGYYDTDIVVIQGDGILYHATLNVGGFNFTNDLCIVLGLTQNDAEQIKRRYVFGLDTKYIAGEDMMRDDSGKVRSHSHASVQAIIEARAKELLYLINRKINALGLQFNRETKLYITGGGTSMMRGCREMFDNYFQFDVKMPTYQSAKISTASLYSTLSLIEFVNKHEVAEPTKSEKRKSGILQKIIDFFTE